MAVVAATAIRASEPGLEFAERRATATSTGPPQGIPSRQVVLSVRSTYVDYNGTFWADRTRTRTRTRSAISRFRSRSRLVALLMACKSKPKLEGLCAMPVSAENHSREQSPRLTPDVWASWGSSPKGTRNPRLCCSSWPRSGPLERTSSSSSSWIYGLMRFAGTSCPLNTSLQT